MQIDIQSFFRRLGLVISGLGAIFFVTASPLFAVAAPGSWIISTIATGLTVPRNMKFALDGSIYVSNAGAQTVLRRDPSGAFTVVAGNGTCDGTAFVDGALATSVGTCDVEGIALYTPVGQVVPTRLYMAERDRGLIVYVDLTTGKLYHLAGTGTNGALGSAPTNSGLAKNATLVVPEGIDVNPIDGNLYVANDGGQEISKIDISSGLGTATISAFAGTGSDPLSSGFTGAGGPATSAQIGQVAGGLDDMTFDPSGTAYIVDTSNAVPNSSVSGAIEMVSTGGIISRFAGGGATAYTTDGTLLATNWNIGANVSSVIVAANGWVYITTFGDQVWAVIGGYVYLVAGSLGTNVDSGDGGLARNAHVANPNDLAVDPEGNLYILDTDAGTIRELTNPVPLVTPTITPSYTNTPTPQPTCVWNACCVTGTGIISTVAGSGSASATNSYGSPAVGASLGNSGRLPGVLADLRNSNFYISLPDVYNGVGMVDAGTGMLTQFAGAFGACNNTGDGGAAVSAKLCIVGQLGQDLMDNVYIPNLNWQVVRKVDRYGVIKNFAGTIGGAGYSGDGGPATSAKLNNPSGVAADTLGNVYIADQGNNVIRKVDGAGIISTIAGTGVAGFAGDGGAATAAQLKLGTGPAIGGGDVYVDGNNLYIVDTGNSCIRRVDLTTGIITTVAGTGASAGFSGDGGAATAAKLAFPESVAVDNCGHLLIADTNNQRIRSVDPGTGVITTIAGNAIGIPGTGDGGPASAATFYRPITTGECRVQQSDVEESGIGIWILGSKIIRDHSGGKTLAVDCIAKKLINDRLRLGRFKHMHIFRQRHGL